MEMLPLAPILIAYGIRDALAEIQNICDDLSASDGCNLARFFAFLDDIVLCVPHAIAVILLKNI